MSSVLAVLSGGCVGFLFVCLFVSFWLFSWFLFRESNQQAI